MSDLTSTVTTTPDAFLEFRECAGCGELFPIRNKMARKAKWCSERCRKAQYSTPCVDCGGPTGGSNGRGEHASKRCVACDLVYRTETAEWTRDTIIAAIRRWALEHGEPPTAPDWRRRGDYWPGASMVLRIFGLWADAVETAGFTRPAVGMYGRAGEDPEFCAEIRERYENGESSIELAEVYGCTSTAILYRIRKVGGQIRTQEGARENRRRKAFA
jgi:hypothetical protein